MDIYTALASKPHNSHYLNRYVFFISSCVHRNIGLLGYIERHHICPQADDMFPEYSNLNIHKWNLATLTPRQHFIAHMLLWKTFPTAKSQTFAIWSMKHKNGSKINSRLYEQLKIDFAVLSSEIHSDKITIKDKLGNVAKVFSDDPRYLSGEYVGIMKGMKWSEESKNAIKGLAAVKDTDGNYFKVKITDSRYISRELLPVTSGLTWKIEDTTNYKKPKSAEHKRNIAKYITVKDPITLEIMRVSKSDKLYISGYYIGVFTGSTHSEEAKKKMSIAAQKPQNMCSCMLCGVVVSVNNLLRHQNGKKCIPMPRP